MTATTFDTAVVLRKMTRAEARRCADEIKLGIETVGKKLLELYEGDGWQALGYSTWRDCVKAEFGYSQSYAYRLLAHEEVNQTLLSFSPIGENPILPLAEAQARPLARLEPEQQCTAWEAAVATAGGQPTAKQVSAAVRQVLADSPPEPEIFSPPEVDPATGGDIVAEYLLKGFNPPETLVEINDMVAGWLRHAREAIATQSTNDIDLRIDSINKLDGARAIAYNVNLNAARITGMLFQLAELEFIEPFKAEGREQRLATLGRHLNASDAQATYAMENERDIILEIKSLFNTADDFKSWWKLTQSASDKRLRDLAINHPDAHIEKWHDVWFDCVNARFDAYEYLRDKKRGKAARFFRCLTPTPTR